MSLFPRLTRNRPIVDGDGAMTQESSQFMDNVADLARYRGTGSPEGVVRAREDSIYIDSAGVAGAILYVKRDASDVGGDTSKGWILV